MTFTEQAALVATRTRVVLEDDLDGGPADHTIEFAIDGVTYVMDLSSKHADELHEAFAPWVASARRTSRAPRSRSIPPSAPKDPAQLKAKREWATRQGYTVNAKGRIPRAVEEAYAAAHDAK